MPTIKATRGAIARLLLPLVLLAAILGMRPALATYYRSMYPIAYQDAVWQAAADADFDPALILAIIRTESDFDPTAVSSAGARGLMQITPETLAWGQSRFADWQELTEDDLFDPEINIQVGVGILSLLREAYPQTDTMLAAYNAGYGHVADWLADTRYSSDGISLDNIPYSETDRYIQKIHTAITLYEQLYSWE